MLKQEKKMSVWLVSLVQSEGTQKLPARTEQPIFQEEENMQGNWVVLNEISAGRCR